MEDCTIHPDDPSNEEVPHACIHLRDPFPDCYCMNISSFNIPKMLAFCNGDFRSCPIFRREPGKTTLSCGRGEGDRASSESVICEGAMK